MEIIDALRVFIYLLIFEYVWTRCVFSVHESPPSVAAAWSSTLYVVGTVALIDVVNDPWLMLPAAAGAWVGTYYPVYKRRKNAARLSDRRNAQSTGLNPGESHFARDGSDAYDLPPTRGNSDSH